jgi:hypothetical protein
MKKIFNLFLAFTAFTAATSITSCTKTCDKGYEGSKCDTEVRAKILNTYKVQESCSTTGTATYNVTISKSGTDVTKVLVTPFAGYPAVTATVSVDGTTLTIESQTVAGFSYSGTGTITGDGATLSVTYNISGAGGGAESCTGTWSKQ